VLHIWEKQVKRLQTWLLRIFFGATVAFELPLRAWAKPRVVAFAFALLLPLLGKAAAGALAKPATQLDRRALAFSTTTIGELAFVVAVVGHHELHETSADSFAAVCLAVLASNVFGPFLLRRSLAACAAQARAHIAAAQQPDNGEGGQRASETGCLRLRCRSRWGLQSDILRVLAESRISVLELRMDTVQGDVAYEALLGCEHDSAPLSVLRERLASLLWHDADACAVADVEDEDADEGGRWASRRGLRVHAWVPPSSPAHTPMHSPTPSSTRSNLFGFADPNIAAAAVDAMLAAASAAEELEHARAAMAVSGHGLLGFVRSQVPAALEEPAVIAAANEAAGRALKRSLSLTQRFSPAERELESSADDPYG